MHQVITNRSALVCTSVWYDKRDFHFISRML